MVFEHIPREVVQLLSDISMEDSSVFLETLRNSFCINFSPIPEADSSNHISFPTFLAGTGACHTSACGTCFVVDILLVIEGRTRLAVDYTSSGN